MTNEHRPPEHGLALKEISLKEMAGRGGHRSSENPHRMRVEPVEQKSKPAPHRFGYGCRRADYGWRLFVGGLMTCLIDFQCSKLSWNSADEDGCGRSARPAGTLVMTGSRSSRSAARYEADRALFLMLLSAPYHSRLSERMIQANNRLACGARGKIVVIVSRDRLYVCKAQLHRSHRREQCVRPSIIQDWHRSHDCEDLA